MRREAIEIDFIVPLPMVGGVGTESFAQTFWNIGTSFLQLHRKWNSN
jgi:hypothetical protein